MENCRWRRLGVVLTAAAVLAEVVVEAQPPTPQQLGVIVYPAKGQSPETQRAEENACYGWAQKQTGIDPTAPPPKAPPPEKGFQADGSGVKGAAGGALVGTAVGAIVGETGEGAAIGAIAGTLRGRRKSKEKRKEEQKAAEQQVQGQHAYAMETFNKALGACLEAKGYTVK
jgi:outer membrane protein with glycine zipper